MNIVVGVDAANLRMGGGRTHLRELLEAVDPQTLGRISELRVWGSAETLNTLPRQPWLTLDHQRDLDGRGFERLAWQARKLPALARSVDVIFAPGGMLWGAMRIPTVTMCRNMLLFDAHERARYGRGRARVRLEALRIVHARSLRRASAAIFLTRFAKAVVEQEIGTLRSAHLIPHGVNEAFRMDPRPVSRRGPFRVTYVSYIAPYKHQMVVAHAVALARSHIPIELRLIGAGETPQDTARLVAGVRELDPRSVFIRLEGALDRDRLISAYRDTDLFVYASSCESLPNIILEAMAAGLPIVSSRSGPMPELIGDAGRYFDYDSVPQLVGHLFALFNEPDERARMAHRAYDRALRFTWRDCARETLRAIASVARS